LYCSKQPVFFFSVLLSNCPCILISILPLYLISGLRDLADFLPASLAAIVSYLSAEVTRGIWKPVMLNGMDWPSPAATLPVVESEIKEVLAFAGVHINICPRPRMSMPVCVICSFLFFRFTLSQSIIFSI